ncbi:hypothetical protein D3C76_842340 [compost metagenome]
MRNPVEFQAADGLVGRVVQVGGARGQVPLVLTGNGEVVVLGRTGDHVDVAETASLFDGLLRPDAGFHVVRHAALGQQVQRDLGELLAGAALQEQHLVVGGDGQQVTQVLLGLLGDGDVLIAAVAHFHDRQATALPVEHFGLGALQYSGGQRRGTGAEVIGSLAHIKSRSFSRRSPAVLPPPGLRSHR